MPDVTHILNAIDAGDPKAAAELLPLVYDELRKLAAAQMANERPGHTLDATALVHEVFLKLGGERRFATRLEWVRSLAMLAGLGGDTKSGVTVAEAKAFADQAVAALADTIKAGWANRVELNEQDFNAVRDRADFQKLVAKLEKKLPPKQGTPPPKEPKKLPPTRSHYYRRATKE
jgi:hypothetical protein